MELLTHDFYYDLPEELIAQTPVEPRDHSRLLVYSRAEDKVTHAHFYDLPSFLKKGDLLVINNTKVIPARIFAHMEGRETTFEILLLRRKDYTRWECIMRPARKAKKGSVLKVSDELSAEVEDVGDYGVGFGNNFFQIVAHNRCLGSPSQAETSSMADFALDFQRINLAAFEFYRYGHIALRQSRKYLLSV